MRDTNYISQIEWTKVPPKSETDPQLKKKLRRIMSPIRIAKHEKLNYSFLPFPAKALRLLEQGELKPLDAIVLLVMIDHWNPKTRSCFATESAFMVATGVQIRALQESWRRLSDAGLVKTFRVRKPEKWCPENTTGRRFYLVFSEPDGVDPDEQNR